MIEKMLFFHSKNNELFIYKLSIFKLYLRYYHFFAIAKVLKNFNIN
jgi:hypothetical protein